MLSPEADIILAIDHQRKHGPTRFNLQWIKAHQDDNLPNDQLDVDAKVNQSADLLAKEERLHGIPFENRPYQGSGAMLRRQPMDHPQLQNPHPRSSNET